MSVSFVEPDISKLRNQLASDFAIADDDDDDYNGEYALKPALSRSSSRSSVDKPPVFTAEATLNNTNSNSLLFKTERSTERRRSTSRRRISVASSRSSSVSKEPAPDTSFFKNVAFDTINIAYHDDEPAWGFRLARPSFSSFSSAASVEEDDTFRSFSVSSKHEDYTPNFGSRTFLCALSSATASWHALEWLMQQVMEDGDELLCLKVDKETGMAAPYYREKAEQLLTRVVHSVVDAFDKKIKVVVELAVGSVKHIVRQAVLLYQPAIVVVGTSIKQYQRVMRYMSKKSTLSNYFINHSPVPVIVVVQELVQKTNSTLLANENYLTKLTSRDNIQGEHDDVKQTYTSLLPHESDHESEHEQQPEPEPEQQNESERDLKKPGSSRRRSFLALIRKFPK